MLSVFQSDYIKWLLLYLLFLMQYKICFMKYSLKPRFIITGDHQKCYNLVNVISISKSQSDHIKQLLYLPSGMKITNCLWYKLCNLDFLLYWKSLITDNVIIWLMYQLFQVITLSSFNCSLKLVLTAISEQRPPVNNR